MHRFLTKLDRDLEKYHGRLVQEVGLAEDVSKRLASCIANDLCHNPDLLSQLENTSVLPLRDRFRIIESFYLDWPKLAHSRKPTRPLPGATSMTKEQYAFVHFAELLPSLYVNVVFVADNLFDCLKKGAPSDSVSKKCASFIRDNPIRALRNALAHGSWRFAGYGAVEYWAREGAGTDPCPTCKKPRKEDPIKKLKVDRESLNFYMGLCGYTAWVTLLSCLAVKGMLDE